MLVSIVVSGMLLQFTNGKKPSISIFCLRKAVHYPVCYLKKKIISQQWVLFTVRLRHVLA